MLCESIPRELEPRLELNIKSDIRGLDSQALARTPHVESATVFGMVMPAKILCRCGAIAEIDRSILRTKKDLGKVVECRRCRNIRIAREKDELDNDYFGIQECSE